MTQAAWRWLSVRSILAIHAEQVAEHGGGTGVRDAALPESALARPVNLAAYGSPDAAALAGAYAYGLARNHPFVDGNKRTAFVAAATFLLRNGLGVEAAEAEVVLAFVDLAAGRMDEEALASWFRQRMAPS
ncbi:type II toxin-antitoxin system death-on-curing family toxin [Vineibacter terrae]|uniref:Type II toxin-antitoxin system death-on-curing family toxin n=1 Tax=Vineibacter terrae TaxID=2586908 RepID=A0A5C8PD87_9HYPH|nr:type II toxin-antitoxin system death-on-curing family toxin [Vineibacter terrae]TXL71334.1 type II toxin-antitoxin system death-on-curing family toxin [Vineibacter terrae]